jgi:hypothetical protein
MSEGLIENITKLLGELPDSFDTIHIPLENGSGLVRLGLVMAIDYSTLVGDYVETSIKYEENYPEMYTDSTAQNLIIIEHPEKYRNEIENFDITKKELKRLKKIYVDFIQADPKEYVMIELNLQEKLFPIGNLHKIKYLGMNGRIENQAFIHTHGEPFVPKLYVNESNDVLIVTEYLIITDTGINNTTKPYIKNA